MKLYLSADWHLNHANIIKHCNRPFKNVNQMNNTIIHNCNIRLKPLDTLIHVGDLLYTSGKMAEANITTSNVYERVKNLLILLKGNHDRHNNIKNMLDYTVITFGKKRFLITHIPPSTNGYENKKYDLSYTFPHIDCILCGHVHCNWKTMIYKTPQFNIPIINVGVDVWNFQPVPMTKLFNVYLKLKQQEDIICL